MKRITIDLWVGIFVAIGIASLIFLALKVANLTPKNASNYYQLKATFTNIGGLKNKAPIKASGVLIGRVSNIYLDQKEYKAVVILSIDKRYKFSRDVSAEILTSGLLGEQYIGLTQGGDLDNLQPGDRIKFTSSAMVLEQLIGKFMTNAAEGNGNTTASKLRLAQPPALKLPN